MENLNGNITYYFIASDGVILEKSKYLIYDLPIISGLVLNDNNVGDFLEDRMLNVVRGLDLTVDMDLMDVMHKVFLAVDLLKEKPGVIDLRSGDIILLGES